MLTACVYSPESGDYVDPTDTEIFGFAEHGGAEIKIFAKEKDTGNWDQVGTATASNNGIPYGGETLFPWSATVDFSAQAKPIGCYWGYPGTCSIPAGHATAELRFSEVGSDLGNMVVFEDGGVDCVNDAVDAGQDWLSAGWGCRSTSYPSLFIHWFT